MELLGGLSRRRRGFLSQEEIGARRWDEHGEEHGDGAYIKERTSLHGLHGDLIEVRRVSSLSDGRRENRHERLTIERFHVKRCNATALHNSFDRDSLAVPRRLPKMSGAGGGRIVEVMDKEEEGTNRKRER
jgi:hypothetical protein